MVKIQVNNGKQNATPNTLDMWKRIESVEDSLGTKSQINDVRMKSVKLGQEDMTPEFLQQMAGTTPISGIPLDKSVTPAKTSFFKNGKNLFNKATITSDYFVLETNGTLSPNTSYVSSDYIQVDANTTYTNNQGFRMAFYDNTKTFISGLANLAGADPSILTRTYTTPNNAKYVRVTWLKTKIDSAQLELGSSSTSYEAYKEYVPKENLEKFPFSADDIPNGALTFEKTKFVVMGKNLFNKDTITPDNYVNQTNGVITSSTSYDVSDYISVLGNTNYSISGTTLDAVRIAYYDNNKVFINGIFGVTNPVTTPVNTAFVRFSFTKGNAPSVQIEKSSAPSNYESYNVSINYLKVDLPPNSVDNASIKPLAVTKDKVSFSLPSFQQTKNLFNKNTVTLGYYVNQTNGTLGANSGHKVSDYIPVTSSTQYSLNTDSSARIAYYDSNKTFISGALAPSSPVTTPVNCAFIRVSYASSTISVDSVQVEQGAVSTTYAPFGFTSTELLASNSNNPNATRIINLPPKLFGLVGQELNIYFDNIIEGKDTSYTFDVVCGKGQQFDNFWRFVPDIPENRTVTINAYIDNNLVASATSTIIVSAANVGSGLTKKVIVIGDSTTANGIAITKLNTNFSTDPMNISTMGTRGTAPNQHEGRSGWKALDYVSSASVNDTQGNPVTNAFWNPNTSTFDFSYYISTSGLGTPDYVIINLGINDMFSYSDDGSANTEITNILSRYTTMINSIKAYNSGIKIGIAVTIPPNYSQNPFGKDYGANQNRSRYKRNHLLWLNQLISTYKNREVENLYLIPIHTNLDTRYNFGTEQVQVNARNTETFTSSPASSGVHPADSGYWQIADVYWYFLKSFEV